VIDLAGKVAIVTGAASFHGDPELPTHGQGSQSAVTLAELGASVVLADVNGAAAEKRAERIRDDGGRAIAVQTDVRDEEQVRRMVETAVEEFGRLDILHNNAANLDYLFDPGDPEVTNLSVDTWRAFTETMLLGSMLGCKHAIPAMLQSGGGSIICMSSSYAELGEINLTVYSTAKAGINQLVRVVSSQWGKEGIRCNAVAPGLILSPVSAQLDEDILNEYERASDTPYLGRPIDTVVVVAFLASDLARYVTGQVIRVDGGLTVRSPLASWQRERELQAATATEPHS
jgi:NAD(P)-dependent dehydrogenase (short-subunit alcohol dehydrogenase family)